MLGEGINHAGVPGQRQDRGVWRRGEGDDRLLVPDKEVGEWDAICNQFKIIEKYKIKKYKSCNQKKFLMFPVLQLNHKSIDTWMKELSESEIQNTVSKLKFVSLCSMLNI